MFQGESPLFCPSGSIAIGDAQISAMVPFDVFVPVMFGPSCRSNLLGETEEKLGNLCYATLTRKLILGEQFLSKLEIVYHHQNHGGTQEYCAPLPEPKVFLAKDDRGRCARIVREEVQRSQEGD